MQKKINIIDDIDGKKVVIIQDVRFKGKRKIDWKDSVRLNGTAAKAKANAAQGIPELIEVASNKRFQDNLKSKHSVDAKKGWYRYTSNFALPVYDDQGDMVRYNIFRIEMLIRHSSNGKKYLYDMVNIKKRNEHPA